MNDTVCGAPRLLEGRKPLRTAILCILALGLVGCGAGASDLGGSGTTGAGASGGPSTPTQTFSISTGTLPSGQPGVAFPTTTLAAGPVAGPVVWTVTEGALPDGLVLTEDGRITGTPRASGVSTFTASASSDGRTATRTFAVSIAAFGLVALEGLVDGTAFTDTAVLLTCVGASGPVRFEVVENRSGGFLGLIDAEQGSATWRTGSTGGNGADRLRAVDTRSGASAEVAFEVQRDPTAGFVAEFGSTDVWYVDTSRKHGAHPYATDFQAVLAAMGLRLESSTTQEGTRADRLAETCARLAMLRHLSRYFLRGADGSRGAGLPISFPWAEPTGFQRPVEGSWLAGAPARYSVISVVDGTQPGIIGTAFTDGTQNGRHENDTSSAGTGELGVFANRFVETINLAYNNLELRQDPLRAEDADLLRAILHGLPTADPRVGLLRNAIEGVGRSLASVAAHEIGHSLGLAHTSPYVAGSLMNGSGVFGPDVPQYFLAEDLERLRGALPGTGRLAGGAAKITSAPEGGVSVCEGERCNLTLAAAPASPRAHVGCACGGAHGAR